MSVKPHSLAVSKPDRPWQALREQTHWIDSECLVVGIGISKRDFIPWSASEERGQEGRGAGQGENRSGEAEIAPTAEDTRCSRRKNNLEHAPNRDDGTKNHPLRCCPTKAGFQFFQVGHIERHKDKDASKPQGYRLRVASRSVRRAAFGLSILARIAAA